MSDKAYVVGRIVLDAYENLIQAPGPLIPVNLEREAFRRGVAAMREASAAVVCPYCAKGRLPAGCGPEWRAPHHHEGLDGTHCTACLASAIRALPDPQP